VQSTEQHQDLPVARGARVALYGLLAIVVLTALVLVMLAGQAMA
jgi:hypothetical protein